MEKCSTKKSVYLLPLFLVYIKDGENITAMPLEVNIHYKTRKNSDDTTSTYNSGFRYAIYRVDNKIMMNLLIDQDLGVRPEYKLDLN